jgi:ATP-dependent DNA helicase RecQ
MTDLTTLLHTTFGFPAFRANQEAVCRAVIDGRDALLVMPTGAGKSLCYQLPAIARTGTALVVSPLIALMDDQAAKLSAAGLRVARIHSNLSRDDARIACRDYLSGSLDFLFIAPERMRVPGFPEMLARRKPTLIAIDEAHCISVWGHDFRPDYRTLGDHLPALRPAPILALTATATPTVQKDIVAQLQLHDPALFIHGFRRSNLAIEVVELSKPRRHEFTVKLLSSPAARPAIVYTPSRRDSEALAAELARHFPAAAYHAGLDASVRQRVQRAFQSGKLEVVVATIAFGMGIDKADVRTIVHTALPASVEAFYQEIGRAGRDGLPSRSVLLHSYADRKIHESFLERDYPPASDLARVAAVLTDDFLMPEPLCRKLKMAPDLFTKSVEKLAAQGAVQLDFAGNVRLADEARRADSNPASPASWRAAYEAQIAFRRSQIDRMVAFAETQQCRMTAIIRHFGDTADAHRPCGICDFCSPSTTTAQTFAPPTTEESRQLNAILRELSGSPGRSPSTGKLYSALSEGALRGTAAAKDRKLFDVLLDALARAGLITLIPDTFTNPEGNVIPYKKAALTHEGRSPDASQLIGVVLPATSVDTPTKSTRKHVASRATGTNPRALRRATENASADDSQSARKSSGRRDADRTPEEQLEHRQIENARVAKRAELTDAYSPEQKELDKKLREWRKTEAAANGRPAFFVLTDAILIKVVMAAPTSLSQLLSISGIGQEKADRFGAAIIAICRESSHADDFSVARTVKAQPPKYRAVPRDPLPVSTIKERSSPIQQFGEPTPTFHRPRPPPSDPAAELTPAQQLLDANLRAWRKSEAERIGLPQFFVLGSSTLRSIVLLRPRSVAHLQSISGIGPEKAEKFGAAILALCNA